MMKHPLIFLLAFLPVLTSCATTGNPTQGGLFGWSSSQADERISARERRLDELDRENAYLRSRSRSLEDTAAARQRQLDATR